MSPKSSEAKGANQTPLPTMYHVTEGIDVIFQLSLLANQHEDEGVQHMKNLLDEVPRNFKVGPYEEESTMRFIDFGSPITEDDAKQLLQTAQDHTAGQLPMPQHLMRVHEVLREMGEEYHQEHKTVSRLLMGMRTFLGECSVEGPELEEDPKRFRDMVVKALTPLAQIRKENFAKLASQMPGKEFRTPALSEADSMPAPKGRGGAWALFEQPSKMEG